MGDGGIIAQVTDLATGDLVAATDAHWRILVIQQAKDGYNEIEWDPSAQLVWGTDLEADNTILLRATVS